MSDLIRDAGTLNKEIAKFGTLYQSAGARAHTLLVSAMFQVASPDSGNPKPLTTLFNHLRSNDRVAVRQFIRRVHIAVGLGTDTVPEKQEAEFYTAAAEAGKVFEFREKEFQIVQGRMDQRKRLCKLCETVLIEPEAMKANGWLPVLDRNNFSEIRTFGDAQVIEGIHALAKRAAGENASVKSTVSPAVKALLERFDTMATQMEESGQIEEAKADGRMENLVKRTEAKPRSGVKRAKQEAEATAH